MREEIKFILFWADGRKRAFKSMVEAMDFAENGPLRPVRLVREVKTVSRHTLRSWE